MLRFLGLQIDPSPDSEFYHDYWEEFSKVNANAPEVEATQVSSKRSTSSKGNKKAGSGESSRDGVVENGESRASRLKGFFMKKAVSVKGLVFKNEKNETSKTIDPVLKARKDGNVDDDETPANSHAMTLPNVPEGHGLEDGTKSVNSGANVDKRRMEASSTNKEQHEGFASVAVQTDMSYLRDEEELPYSCCCCFRTSTPCIVWVFVAISLIFFKMGIIVTGRWMYLSQSSFDEIVFYIVFTICLGFATFYFRHGTKYHNPFNILSLVLTVPIMWGLLSVTTFILKNDIFFHVASVIYSVFILPYIGIGIYIAFRFWTTGKLFLRRVDGDRPLEPLCRKLFFATSLMIFDGQLSICATIISMSSTANYQESKHVWISSLIFGPISICLTTTWIIVGYFAMRNENKCLTWYFTILSVNQFILIVGMLLKRSSATGSEFLLVNVAMVVLAVHIGFLVVLWKWIVPNYGKGLKSAIRRTSSNKCIQCAQHTICR